LAFSIKCIGFALGDSLIDVSEISEDFEKAILKTGIPVVFESTTTAYGLALQACSDLQDRLGESLSHVGAIIYVSQSPVESLPASACRIQYELKLDQCCLAFDIAQGCSGFVQGLYLASQILPDVKSVLLICADTYRHKLDRLDRSTSTIFSDAATATLITDKPELEIVGSTHVTDGAGADLLFHSYDKSRNLGKLYMSGSDVLLFTKRVVFKQALDTIQQSGLSLGDITNVVVHQASKLVLDELEKKFGSDINFVRDIARYGNTVSSSIPLLLQDKLSILKQGPTVLSGFGVGLSSSCVVVVPVGQNDY
jgi:3-oxoacyl-[acyl-carrier-protein] synthase-3